MGFMNEKIPEEERWRLRPELFHSLVDKRLLTEGPFRLSEWTIDRERDILLLRLGGGIGEDMPKYLALMWGGKLVKISGFEEVERKNGDLYLTWSEVGIESSSEPLESIDRVEFRKIMREAFAVYGSNLNGEKFKSITVEFAERKRG